MHYIILRLCKAEQQWYIKIKFLPSKNKALGLLKVMLKVVFSSGAEVSNEKQVKLVLLWCSYLKRLYMYF